MSSELETIRHMIGITRDMANNIISKAEGLDVKKRFEVNGKTLNSIYWIVGHMAWAQNNLVIRSTGGPNPEVPFLKFFSMGKPSDDAHQSGPEWNELIAGFNKVHETAMQHLATMDPALLDAPNKLDWEILGAKTMRNTLLHHIRHENNHTGQLLWLINIQGVKTI